MAEQLQVNEAIEQQPNWRENFGMNAAAVVGTVAMVLAANTLFDQEVEATKRPESSQAQDANRAAPNLPSPRNIDIDTRLTVKRASKIFGCELQQDLRPATPTESQRWAKPVEKQCAQHIAKVVGQNSFGWDKKQHEALKQLWQHESGWSANADNPVSTAYGIPQSLQSLHNPELHREYGKGKFSYNKNPLSQIQWGLRYIHRAYGTPAKAWQAWQSRSPHWY